MKTTMQQLIDWMVSENNYGSYGSIHAKANDLLEEEKKQITDAVKYGYLDAIKATPDKSFQDYYKQTYQNNQS